MKRTPSSSDAPPGYMYRSEAHERYNEKLEEFRVKLLRIPKEFLEKHPGLEDEEQIRKALEVEFEQCLQPFKDFLAELEAINKK